MSAPVPLRPLGFGDVLDGAFKILRAHWRPMAVVACGVLAPLQVVTNYTQREMLGQGFGMFFLGLDPSEPAMVPDTELVIGLLVGFVTALVVYPLLFGALTRIAAGAVLDDPVTAGPALRVALRRWPALTGAWVLMLFAAMLPFMAVAVLAAIAAALESVALVVASVLAMLVALLAGAVIASLFLAAAPAMVTEGIGPLRGLRRSATLLGRRILPVFGIVLVAVLLASIVQSVLSAIPTVLGMAVGQTFGWVLVAAGGIAAAAISMAFLAGVAALLYVDGRVRREGLDLEVAADRLEDGA